MGMTDREKLIALMRQVDACICNLCDGDEEPFNHSAGILADHLIANGVVVREKGEWLHVCGKGRHAEYECSECKIHVCFDEKIGGDIPAYKICPNCGADMRKVENG